MEHSTSKMGYGWDKHKMELNKRQQIQLKYNNLGVLLNLVNREFNEIGKMLQDLRDVTEVEEPTKK